MARKGLRPADDVTEEVQGTREERRGETAKQRRVRDPPNTPI